MSVEHWDYVDQLWGYFLQGVENVLKGLEFETFLPDQPIKVSFKPDLRSKIVLITVGREKKSICVEYDKFVIVMIKEARKFFEKLNYLSLYPYNQELKDIDSLEKVYNQKRHQSS